MAYVRTVNTASGAIAVVKANAFECKWFTVIVDEQQQ
jgi:hypothetical protein